MINHRPSIFNTELTISRRRKRFASHALRPTIRTAASPIERHEKTKNVSAAALATGHWPPTTGNWQLATGNWQLATGNWQLATGNLQLAIHEKRARNPRR
jgi:hypothetical protein